MLLVVLAEISRRDSFAVQERVDKAGLAAAWRSKDEDPDAVHSIQPFYSLARAGLRKASRHAMRYKQAHA